MRCWPQPPVGEVWGLGRRLAAQLEAEGVRTVLGTQQPASAGLGGWRPPQLDDEQQWLTPQDTTNWAHPPAARA